MANPVDIRPDHLEMVQGILREYLPVGVKVWVFGSRANWTTKDSSDLDLALEGENALSYKLLGVLKDAFEDSSLPYTVDVVDFHRISGSFRPIVESQRVPLPQEGNDTVQPMPNRWCEATLGELGEVDRGRSRHRPRNAPELYGGPYPFVQTGDIKASGGRITSHSQTYSEIGLSQSRIWPAGTMAITIAANIAETAILTYPACFPDSVVGFVADDSKCDVRFIEYLFRILRANIQHENVGTGSAQDNINLQTLSRLRFSIPPLSEQRAIAHILGTLDDKIELNRQMNETLEEMARALFKSWFVDFDPVRAKMEGRWRPGESLPGLPAHLYDLFPDRLVDSELGEIPEGWGVGTLGDVIKIFDSARVPLNRRQRAERAGPYPYYGAASVMDYIDDFLFDGIYVLIGEDGSVMNENGSPVVQYAWGQFWVNNHAHVLGGRNGVSEEYLYVLLRHQNIVPFVTGAVQPKLNQANLRNLPVVLPNLVLRETFSDLLQPLFFSMRCNQEGHSAVECQRDALLPKLLSNQIRLVLSET